MRDPRTTLNNQIRELLPDFEGQWKPITCKTPTGGTIEWSKVTFAAKQKFLVIAEDGTESYREDEGAMEFYLHQTLEHGVIFFWRVPTRLKEAIQLDTWTERVCGSLTRPDDAP